MNGSILNFDQYELIGNRVSLKGETLSLNNGNHHLTVDYKVRHPLGFEPIKFNFQVGPSSGHSVSVDIASFDNMLQNTNVICVRSNEFANKSLQVIDDALNFVVGQRGTTGAVMNRFEAIASNLSVLEENMTASKSRIEDADIAKESMQLLKQRILSQVQIALGTQMNQSSQQILELLK